MVGQTYSSSRNIWKIQKINFKSKCWYNNNSINSKESNKDKNKKSSNNDKE